MLHRDDPASTMTDHPSLGRNHRPAPDSVDQANRLAVVTGGAKGIGKSVVEGLLDAGCAVVATGRDEVALAALVAAHPGGMLKGVACDVRDENAVAELFESLGPVDILVNNAGISSSAPLHRTPLSEWEQMMAVNATGPFLCTRAVVKSMKDRGWGRIVTVASTASHIGAPYIAAYTASKHAVLGLMRSVAAEVRGTGVTANSVCPSYARTEMTERTLESISEKTGRNTAQAQADLMAQVPLGRLIEPYEVAAAVVYLASEAAAATNGQSIILDGGGVHQ